MELSGKELCVCARIRQPPCMDSREKSIVFLPDNSIEKIENRCADKNGGRDAGGMQNGGG